MYHKEIRSTHDSASSSDGVPDGHVPPNPLAIDQCVETDWISPQHEMQAGFELPSSVWKGMLACYGVFFFAIMTVTGGSIRAVFAIIISALYCAMYFGTARILNRIGGAEKPSPLDRGLALQTWTGAFDRKSVFSQILIIPVCMAIFGVSIAVICSVILP